MGAFVAKLLLMVRGHAGLQALGSWGGADGSHGDCAAARALAYASAAAAAMQREAVDGEALLDWLGGVGEDSCWAADDVSLGELAAFGEWAEDIGVLAGVVRLWVAEEAAMTAAATAAKTSGGASPKQGKGGENCVAPVTETDVMLLLPSRATRSAFEGGSDTDGTSWGWGWGWGWDVEEEEEETQVPEDVAAPKASRSPVAQQAAEAASVDTVLKWREVDAGYWLSQTGLGPAVPAFAAQVGISSAYSHSCVTSCLFCT